MSEFDKMVDKTVDAVMGEFDKTFDEVFREEALRHKNTMQDLSEARELIKYYSHRAWMTHESVNERYEDLIVVHEDDQEDVADSSGDVGKKGGKRAREFLAKWGHG
jgi:hypothetical protein